MLRRILTGQLLRRNRCYRQDCVHDPKAFTVGERRPDRSHDSLPSQLTRVFTVKFKVILHHSGALLSLDIQLTSEFYAHREIVFDIHILPSVIIGQTRNS